MVYILNNFFGDRIFYYVYVVFSDWSENLVL